jgi:methionyl-tRNA synthetase
MSTKVIVAAWPYTHALMGIHNLIPMLSGDMLSRFYRLMNNDVVFVSGCDEYGERMERKAHADRTSPQELADLNYANVRDLLRSFNIELSYFGRTTDGDHAVFVQECLTSLLRRNRIEEQYIASLFCPACERFVSDVFVLGFCTSCRRFDNLNDHYGSVSCATSGPVEFRDPICGICKSSGVSTPLIRESVKRWMIRLDKSSEPDMAHWTELARRETIKALSKTSDWLSISRSVGWGIPIPFDPSQTVFSWADSLLAVPRVFRTVESLRNVGTDVSTIYCMGRDNVPFYSILHPTLLVHLDAGFLAPSVVVANHDICFDGLPCSKSQSRTIDLESAIRLLPSDYWRAYLVSIFPMKASADFSPIHFDDFVRVSVRALDDYIANVHGLCVKYGHRGRNETTHCSAMQVSRLGSLLEKFQTSIGSYDFPSAMASVFEAVQESNTRFNAGVPDGNAELGEFCSDFLREVFVLTSLVSIFMPDTAKRIQAMFNFTQGNRALSEIHQADFSWRVGGAIYEELFPDAGLETAMATIREMVVSIEFSNGIDYTSDKHPVRIKWDACNCETWHQACTIPSGEGRFRDG